jgi:hypothetical protein
MVGKGGAASGGRMKSHGIHASFKGNIQGSHILVGNLHSPGLLEETMHSGKAPIPWSCPKPLCGIGGLELILIALGVLIAYLLETPLGDWL